MKIIKLTDVFFQSKSYPRLMTICLIILHVFEKNLWSEPSTFPSESCFVDFERPTFAHPIYFKFFQFSTKKYSFSKSMQILRKLAPQLPLHSLLGPLAPLEFKKNFVRFLAST